MPDISADPNPFFIDVGNVQNALNLWGTVHSSGYALFSLVGALFATGVRGIGVAPAAAVSLFSMVWAIDIRRNLPEVACLAGNAGGMTRHYRKGC